MTKFTEIFYRGPSDQKLSTIANCCPHLETMFLGSNNPRWLIKYWIVEEVTKHCYPFMIIHPDRQYGSKRLICNQEPQLCCISSLAAPRLPHAWEYHGKYRCTILTLHWCTSWKRRSHVCVFRWKILFIAWRRWEVSWKGWRFSATDLTCLTLLSSAHT